MMGYMHKDIVYSYKTHIDECNSNDYIQYFNYSSLETNKNNCLLENIFWGEEFFMLSVLLTSHKARMIYRCKMHIKRTLTLSSQEISHLPSSICESSYIISFFYVPKLRKSLYATSYVIYFLLVSFIIIYFYFFIFSCNLSRDFICVLIFE